jgi:hypothetical protein
MNAVVLWGVLGVGGASALFVGAYLTWYGLADQPNPDPMPWWWLFCWPLVFVGLTLACPWIVAYALRFMIVDTRIVDTSCDGDNP